MKSPALELILIKIKLQVLADRDVSVRELKCRENESERISACMFVYDDQLGFYA